MVRDVLLVIYAGAWLVTVIITAWRTGTVPAELWAALGIGAGGLVAVFKTDDYVGIKRARRQAKPDPEPLEDPQP